MLEEEVRGGESNRLEFKQDVPKDARKYVKTAVAFSNTQEGKIIFGVSDNREIVGIDGDIFRVMDSIIGEISTKCTPQIIPNAYVITIEDKSLIVVEICSGSRRPYYITSEGMENGTYIRIAGSTHVAGIDAIRDLVSQGSSSSFDATEYIGGNASNKSISDLCRYYSDKTGTEMSAVNLVNAGLLRESTGGYVPTRAFMLLTDNPFYHARIQCARFKGFGETEFIDRKEYNGPIIEQVEEATMFVLNHLNLGAEIAGLYRKDVYEVPPSAIREVIVNAVLHRSYYEEGSAISVAVYDDRIEVDSPGMLPHGLTLEGIKSGHSNPRNIVIAKFFKETKLVEGWGKGIRRVYESCRDQGLKPPEILELDNCIRVILHRTSADVLAEEHNSGIGAVRLNDLDLEILDYLAGNPSVAISSIAEYLNRPVSTVRKSISRLKTKGVLSRTGTKRSGKWVVNQR